MHHVDYLKQRDDHALCGLALENPATLDPTIHPASVCPDCEALLGEYHLVWWREKAEAATAELDVLRVKYRELIDSQQPAQVTRDPSGENPEGPLEIHGRPEDDPASLLGRARKELLELCRRFGEAIPYWRLKNAMDAFSDNLNADERVMLAQEIGSDGSLIRWCTKEIEGLGWQVTNSPVHSDADTMMDAWTEDYYQTPKKTKWRMGRAR